ncbi:glycosyltransferase family 2 protein [Candidatus Microgenomates bacterium]|nr:glycosyltransferase family 2 protein [Candidatus Microgenomates bacterium]
MTNTSVVINVVKEEIEFLPQVLTSIKDFSDEVILVDMTGKSEVKSIGKKFGAKVYEHKFVNYVEPARNFGIEKATKDWILILDPDEELSKSLAKELKEIVSDERAEYVRIPRKNMVFGKWLQYSRWWPDYNIRFFKKGHVSWNEVIHAVPVTTGRGIDLEAKEEFAIVHHHYDSIEQFIERMNRYTSIQAELEFKSKEFSWINLIKQPTSEFLSRYFSGEGYKDGISGLAMSGLQAFSEFVTYLKVWQLKKFEEQEINVNEVIDQMRETEGDFRYWWADALLKNGGGLLQRVKRKLKI